MVVKFIENTSTAKCHTSLKKNLKSLMSKKNFTKVEKSQNKKTVTEKDSEKYLRKRLTRTLKDSSQINAVPVLDTKRFSDIEIEKEYARYCKNYDLEVRKRSNRFEISDLFGDDCDYEVEVKMPPKKGFKQFYAENSVVDLFEEEKSSVEKSKKVLPVHQLVLENRKKTLAHGRQKRAWNKEDKSLDTKKSYSRNVKNSRLSLEFVEGFNGKNETSAVKRQGDSGLEEYREKKSLRSVPKKKRREVRKLRVAFLKSEKPRDKEIRLREEANLRNKQHIAIKLAERIESRRIARESGLPQNAVESSKPSKKKVHPQARRKAASLSKKQDMLVSQGFDDRSKDFEKKSKKKDVDRKIRNLMDFSNLVNNDISLVEREELYLEDLDYVSYYRELRTEGYEEIMDSFTKKKDSLVSSFDGFMAYIRSLIPFDLPSDWVSFLCEFFDKAFRPFEKMWKKLREMGESFLEYMGTDIVDLVNFAYLLSMCHSHTDVLMVLNSRYKFITSSSCSELYIHLREVISNYWRPPMALGLRGELVSQSDDITEKCGVSRHLQKARCFLETVFSSQLVGAIKSLLLSALSLKWFDRDIGAYVSKFVGKPEKMSVMSMICNVLEAFGTLVGFGESLQQGIPLTEIFLSGDPTTLFLKHSEDLLCYYTTNRLYVGLPKEGFMCRKEFRLKATELVEAGKVISSRLSGFATQRRAVSTMLRSLETALAEVTSLLKAQKRLTPIGIKIIGPPGIGKSELMRIYPRIYSFAKGREFDESHIYSRCKSSEYHEGFSNQPFWFYSEVGCEHPDIARSSIPELLTELQSLIDSNPFPCNMAFDGKGKIYTDLEMAIIDSNNITLNTKECMHTPSAMDRRFITCEFVVDEDYIKVLGDGRRTTALDSAKSIENGGNILDRFTVICTEYHAFERRSVPNVLYTGRIEGMCIWFLDYCRAWIKKQDFLREANASSFVEPFLRSLEEKKEFAPLELVDLDELDESDLIDLAYQGFVEKFSDVDYDFAQYLGDPLPVEESKECFKSQANILGAAIAPAVCFRAFLHCKIDSALSFLSDVHVHSKRVAGVCARLSECAIVMSATKSAGIEIVFSPTRWLVLLLLAFVYFSPFGHFLTWVIVAICPFLRWKNFGFVLARLYTQQRLEKLQSDKSTYVRQLLYYIGWNTFGQTISTNRGDFIILAMCGLSGLVFTWYKTIGGGTKLSSEAYLSDFVNPDDANERINELEGAGFLEVMKNTRAVDVPAKHFPYGNTIACNLDFGVHKGEPLELFKAIMCNVMSIKICGLSVAKGIREDKVLKAFLFGIEGNYAVINTHLISEMENIVIHISLSGDWDKSPSDAQVLQLFPHCIEHLGGDVSVISIGRSFRRKTCHLIDGDCPKAMKGVLRDHPIRVVPKGRGFSTDPRTGKVDLHEMLEYQYEHFDGLCGYPIVAEVGDKSCAVIGIHAAGGVSCPTTAVAVRLQKSKIEKAIETLKARARLLPLNSQGAYIMPRTLPSRKSPFRQEYFPNIQCIGTLPGPTKIKKYSRLVKSGYGEDMRSLLYRELAFEPTLIYGVPPLMPFRRNGEYIAPQNIALRKMDIPVPLYDSDVLDVVVRRFTRHIIEGLMSKGVHRLSPLRVQDAVNGTADNPFSRRINVSTSGAFGYPGKKEKYLPLVGDTTREPTGPLKDQVNQELRNYGFGETNQYIFNVQFKDEPREISKCEAGKTRPFYMCALNNLVVARVLMYDFYTKMVEHSEVFCSAIGYNMHTDSDKLIRDFQDFIGQDMEPDEEIDDEECVLEADFAGFDVASPFFIARAAATVIYNVNKHFGYSTFSLKALQGLLTDMVMPIINMDNDLFIKLGMQPSGNLGTAENNCLRNVIMQMYTWYKHEVLREYDFFEYVLPRVYGDDLAMAVRRSVRHWFNMPYFVWACKEYFNMEVTSANKTACADNFLRILDFSFLKRTFSKFYNGKYVGKLDLNSIFKTVEWRMPSGSITVAEQDESTFVSVMWELFFHCQDESQYERFRSEIKSWLVVRHGGEENDYSIHSYQQIYKTIWPDEKCSSDSPNSDTLWEYEVMERQSEMKGGPLSSFSPVCALKANGDSPVLDTVFVDGSVRTKTTRQASIEQRDTILRELSVLKSRMEEINLLLDEKEFDRSNVTTVWAYKFNPQMQQFNIDIDQRRMDLMCEKNDVQKTIQFYEQYLWAHMDLVSQAQSEEGSVDMSKVDIHENILDIGGEDSFFTHAGASKGPKIGQDEVLRIEKFLERPVNLQAVSIPLSTYHDFQLKLWDVLSLNPANRAKLRNFAYFRGDIMVRIAISGSPFHRGKFLISYQPYPQRNDTLKAHHLNLTALGIAAPDYRPLMLNYLSQSPGAITIDVKENKPVEFRVPFISSKSMHRLFNNQSTVISATTSFVDFAEAGTLYIWNITPITAATASPTPITMQVYAHFVDVHLGTTTGTHMEIKTEARDERRSGPVERMSSSLATVSRALSSVPFLGEIAMASSLIFEGISGIAAWFGWSRPTMISGINYVKNRPFASSSQTIGAESIEKTSWDPLQELTVDPRVTGMEVDEMSITHLCGIETFLYTFDWDNSDVPMSGILFNCAVNPCLSTYYVGTSRIWIQPTPMSFAANNFGYWHGDIVFRFEAVVSAFERGKLAIGFDPNIDQYTLITTTIHDNLQFLKVWDVQETQSVEFCVKWAQPRAWNQTIHYINQAQSYGTQKNYPNVGAGWSNGFIFITPFTELQSPVDSAIVVNVYVSARNMQFNYYTDEMYPNNRQLISQAADVTNETISNSVSCFELNDSTDDSAYNAHYYFGEQPLSLRSCLKRYTQYHSTSVTSAAVNALVEYIGPIYRPPSPVYTTATGSSPSAWKIIPLAFLGWRGGIRKRFRFLGTSINARGETSIIACANGLIRSNGTETLTLYGTSFVCTTLARGTAMFVPFTNGGIEVEFPYYSNNLFNFSCAVDSIGTNGTGDMIPTWARNHIVTAETTIANGEVVIYVEAVAAAEDFTFMRYLGAPYFTIPKP